MHRQHSFCMALRKDKTNMHDIWNPWHGCKKISEGCDNCYMYFLDRQRDKNGADIYRVKSNFYYPLSRRRDGSYRVKSGEMLRVCMTSDFFLEEADGWREEAWDIIRARPDVVFFLLTKRPERVSKCLPSDWGDGWENVFFHVTCENQRRTDIRVPLLLSLPFRHKGIMCAPFIGEVHLTEYLRTGQIEQVICGGENYDGARPCHFDWIKTLSAECRAANVTFTFIETGTHFIKDGRQYHLPDKTLQTRMAHKSGMSFQGKPITFHLTDAIGFPIIREALHRPEFPMHCQTCGSRPICNGCAGADCEIAAAGKCPHQHKTGTP